MSETIKKLTIEGFKSIRELRNFELRDLNVLIGANGAGKSNFIGFFRLLKELVEQRLQLALQIMEGGADACLYMGPKVTDQFAAQLYFGTGRYEFLLKPTVDNRFVFGDETAEFVESSIAHIQRFGSGHAEAKLKESKDEPAMMGESYGAPHHVYKAISRWVVYHFHDTSNTAEVRRQRPLNDNEVLRANAENLAAFLYRIRETDPRGYRDIRDMVRLAAPFFDDFQLRPLPTNSNLIQLEWRQKDSDYPFLANQLSDGTLRFICLATALLQPQRPATILFDEPEIGLHPYALTLLGSLFKKTTGPGGSNQIIISTQSAQLLNEFDPEDVIVVERHQGESTFRRLASADLSEWLEEYTLGELWQKNVLGGRPMAENTPLSIPNGVRHS